MPRNSDTFWSRVLFKDFIRHFRKMSPEQIAEDITESMDALDDLNPDGDSFGSLMVRWANERMNGAFATAARENGKKGGRPRKDSSGTEEALESQRRAGEDSLRCDTPSSARQAGSMPDNCDKVIDFAVAENLDVDDARECWYVTTVERDGKTADGKKINNWKAYVRKWCTTRKDRRSA